MPDLEQRVTHVWFRGRELELNQTNLGLFHPRRSTSIVHDRLVQCQSLNQLGVINRSSDLLYQSDVSQVDVG